MSNPHGVKFRGQNNFDQFRPILTLKPILLTAFGRQKGPFLTRFDSCDGSFHPPPQFWYCGDSTLMYGTEKNCLLNYFQRIFFLSGSESYENLDHLIVELNWIDRIFFQNSCFQKTFRWVKPLVLFIKYFFLKKI